MIEAILNLSPIYDYGVLFEKYLICDNLLSIDLSSSRVLNYIRNDEIFNLLFKKFLLLDMDNVFCKLENKYYIKLNNKEKNKVMEFIDCKKDEVKKYRLII